MLSTIGGRSPGELIRNILLRVFHADIATMCNMSGKNEKIALADKRIFSIIRSKLY